MSYPFPIRPGLLAQISLPADLSKAEAKRLAAFVESLAMDSVEPQRALPAPQDKQPEVQMKGFGEVQAAVTGGLAVLQELADTSPGSPAGVLRLPVLQAWLDYRVQVMSLPTEPATEPAPPARGASVVRAAPPAADSERDIASQLLRCRTEAPLAWWLARSSNSVLAVQRRSQAYATWAPSAQQLAVDRRDSPVLLSQLLSAIA